MKNDLIFPINHQLPTRTKSKSCFTNPAAEDDSSFLSFFFLFLSFPKRKTNERTEDLSMVEGVRAAFNIPGCEVCDSGRFHRGFIRTVYSIHENIQNFYLQFSISWPRNEEESLEPGGLKKRERERFENVERTPLWPNNDR